MDFMFSFVIFLVQFHLYSCQARNALCNTDDYFQDRERDRRRDVPVRRQYVISDENGKFDQYNDLKKSDINFPDHDYSFELVEEDDNQNSNYPPIMDNDNEIFPSFAIEPRFSRKTNSQTSFSHGARHLHHRHSKKYYPHAEEIIIVTPSESQSRQYYLRAIQAPVHGRRNNLHRRSPNTNINVNTNGYKSDPTPQHLSEDVSLSKSQLIGELIDQESNLEKPQPLTDSVSLLEILNNDNDQSDRQHSKNSVNNVNVDTNVNERAYLAHRHSLDENKNVNVNVNSNIDNDFDERAIGPAVIVNARKNLKLLGLNRRDIDALRSERRSKNQNSNTNVNSNDAGFYVRPEPIPEPVFTDRNVPYIILDSPRSFANAAYRKNNKNTNVNVNTNGIDSQEYY